MPFLSKQNKQKKTIQKKKKREEKKNLPKYQMKKAAIAQQMTINIDNKIIMVFLRPETKARGEREIRFTSKVISTHQHYLFDIKIRHF